MDIETREYIVIPGDIHHEYGCISYERLKELMNGGNENEQI